ncbi:MAG: hypothetical protein ABR865_10255, partial [Terracidiphilus sp.]
MKAPAPSVTSIAAATSPSSLVTPVSRPAVLAASSPPAGVRWPGDQRDSRTGVRRYITSPRRNAA